EVFRSLLAEIESETGAPLIDIAAALAVLAQGDRPLLMAKDEVVEARPRSEIRTGPRPGPAAVTPSSFPGLNGRPPRERSERPERTGERAKPRVKSDEETETFRIEVGHQHGVKPGNIVGAIANEAGLESQH